MREGTVSADKFDGRPLAEKMDDEIPWARMDRQQGQIHAMGFSTWQKYLAKYPAPPRYPTYKGKW